MLRRSASLRLLLLGLCLPACQDGSDGSDRSDGFATPHVGDRIDDGVVTSVSPGRGCQVITLEHDPVWACSEEQIAAARTGSGPTSRAGIGTPVADAPTGTTPAQLVASDCKTLADLHRPAIKSRQRAQLESARRELLSKCLPTRERRYVDDQGVQLSYCPPVASSGGTVADAGIWPAAAPSGGNASTSPSGGNASTSLPNPVIESGASEYSTTNTQLVGIDEADFVKNDSGHVYVLSRAGLHVIDAWPAADAHQLTLLPLPGEPTRLFLAGDRLVVYTRTNSSGGGAPSAAQGCTYGYNCRLQAEPGSTAALVFDVSTPAAPRELRRYDFSGGYVSSRRVGNTVYTVVADKGLGSVPGVDVSLTVSEPGELDTVYAERLAQSDLAVDELEDALFLPWLRETRDGRGATTTLPCESGLVARAASGQSFTSLVSFDLLELDKPQRQLVASKPGFVYASGQALYMATDGTSGAEYYGHGGVDEQSTLHKFALSGVNTSYVGSTLIPGHVLNQFSMDERDAVLRVATSSGWVPNPGVSSNIVSVAERAGALQVIGQLNGLAPQEDIRSVRFDGERGFVVTFKKTDPLFVIDLVDPTQPSVLGELKIPGFSTYMQPMDKDHVLAIGFDADDKGSFAYFDGIQIQIFDVSDLTMPKLQHKTVIGTRGSASEALTNHLAFNYFAPKGLLALPMTVCDGGGDGTFGDKLSFSGLMVFDVSLLTGIHERGRMPFVEPASLGSGLSCSSWWSDASSAVKRSIIMDDYVIGLSDSQYQVAALSSLGNVLKSLPLGTP